MCYTNVYSVLHYSSVFWFGTQIDDEKLASSQSVLFITVDKIQHLICVSLLMRL